MAISYLSEVIKGSDYITPYDQDVVHKAMMYKQQQYDAKVSEVQQGIDQLSSIDVIAQEDKQYRDVLVNGLVQKANSLSGMDFTKNGVMAQITNAKIAITSDERLIGAVQDTATIRAKQKNQQELIKKGKYSDANMWADSQADIAYLNAKKEDPNARYQGSANATEYRDVNKSLATNAEKIAKIRASGRKQIPMVRNVYDAEAGGYVQVHDMVELAGISDQELAEKITQTLSPQEQKQLEIDARYNYRAASPEQLVMLATQTVAGNYSKLKQRQGELDIAVNQSVAGSKECNEYLTEQKSVAKMYEDGVKGQSAVMAELAKTNPDALRIMLHKNQLATTYGSLYSNQSEKITEDKGYYTTQSQLLKKAQLIEQKANNTWDRQVDVAKLDLAKQKLDLDRDKLDANIADDEADNTRADLKLSTGTSGSRTGGNTGNIGTTAIGGNTNSEGVSGTTTNVEEKSNVAKKYSDFTKEAVELKEEEIGAVMSTLVEIAHQKNSAMFSDPALMKHLGLGKGAAINITDANGKINPIVAQKLGKYFDEIGISGIVPKMQKYYEAIARGGHPDAYATFKEYLPLANKLADIKDRQKAHNVIDVSLNDPAYEKVYTENKVRKPIQNFKNDLMFMNAIKNKIDTYEPDEREAAKYQGAGFAVGNENYYILQENGRFLSEKGAKILGITAQNRKAYNDRLKEYDSDILEQVQKAKGNIYGEREAASSTTRVFTPNATETKKDVNTEAMMRGLIAANPNKVMVAGEESPLTAADPRIANATNVKLLNHTASNRGNNTANVEVTYIYDKDGESKTGKYVAKMELPKSTLDSKEFRGGAYRSSRYQDVIETIGLNGGRSTERYIDFRSPNTKHPDPVTYVFEKSPYEQSGDNQMYLKVVVKDEKGNDIGFRFGSRGKPDDLVRNLELLIQQGMEKGLSKTEVIAALRKTQ